MKLSENAPDRRLDIRGVVCPYTLIDTREALQEMDDGQLLEVWTDWEPAVLETLPNYCRTQGYPCEVVDREDGTWRVLIRKGD